jgi:hypothetical protein
VKVKSFLQKIFDKLRTPKDETKLVSYDSSFNGGFANDIPVHHRHGPSGTASSGFLEPINEVPITSSINTVISAGPHSFSMNVYDAN